MPQHIRIAQQLAEVQQLIEKLEETMDKGTMDPVQRDNWLDRLLDLKDMQEELISMYKGTVAPSLPPLPRQQYERLHILLPGGGGK